MTIVASRTKRPETETSDDVELRRGGELKRCSVGAKFIVGWKPD
jgi:hypothetical protein